MFYIKLIHFMFIPLAISVNICKLNGVNVINCIVHTITVPMITTPLKPISPPLCYSLTASLVPTGRIQGREPVVLDGEQGAVSVQLVHPGDPGHGGAARRPAGDGARQLDPADAPVRVRGARTRAAAVRRDHERRWGHHARVQVGTGDGRERERGGDKPM